MRPSSFVLLFALFIASVAARHRGEHCLCDDVYDPVCCKGEFYSNMCVAECDGYSEYDCEKGECDDHNHCKGEEYHPFCCDGEDYDNLCEVEYHGFSKRKCDEGQCDTDSDCHCKLMKGEQPVCCKGKYEFESMCEAECAGYDDKHCEEDNGKCGMGGHWDSMGKKSKRSSVVFVPSSSDSFASQIVDWWISAHPLLVCFVMLCGLAGIATVVVRAVKMVNTIAKKKDAVDALDF